MLKRDDDGALIVLGICVVGIIIIAYIIITLISAFVGAAAVGGTVFGGCSAIKNYWLSFKENVIESNKKTVVA